MAIIDSTVVGDRRQLFRFSHGLRLELFYALQTLTDEDAAIHRRWRQWATGRLTPEFHRSYAALGATPLIWPLLADAPGPGEPEVPFDDLRTEIASLDAVDFRRGVLVGVLHDEGHVDQLI